MANTIEVQLTGNGWYAEFKGPQATEIRRLFGTPTIPTPFSASAPTAMVLAAVQHNNPGMLVTVAGAPSISQAD